MVVGRRAGVANRQVEAFVGQRDDPVGQLELDANVRVLAQEGLDVRCHLLAPERHRRRDAHQATRLGGQVARLDDAARDLREALGGLLDQPLAGLGEAHRARRALHQRLRDAAFQFGDALADAGLRQPEALRHLREAAELGQQGERVDLRPQQVDALLGLRRAERAQWGG